jgi:beta-lactamase class A
MDKQHPPGRRPALQRWISTPAGPEAGAPIGQGSAWMGSMVQTGLASFVYPPHDLQAMNARCVILLLVAIVGSLWFGGCTSMSPERVQTMDSYVLDYSTPCDAALQSRLEAMDASLRERFGMTTEQTSVGVLDLRRLRLAMVRPDRIDYAASVPKIGILLGWFQAHPEAVMNLSAQTRHELGLMIKVSDNQMATKFSRELGLKEIQQAIHRHGLYDPAHGGGLWMGKHYGAGGERLGDPVANHSHAATVRQLLRYYLLLEQGRLVSPQSSRLMREIFASPDIAHRDDKFVKGLAGRNAQVLRKAGWWENWFLDTAIVTGAGRHYLIVAMTHHPKGDAYLEEFARGVDELMMEGAEGR